MRFEEGDQACCTWLLPETSVELVRPLQIRFPSEGRTGLMRGSQIGNLHDMEAFGRQAVYKVGDL